MEMVDERQSRRTHLFTVRLWVEHVSQDGAEVRGRVQHVLSGDVQYFRSWQALTTFFDAMLQEKEGPHSVLRGDVDTDLI